MRIIVPLLGLFLVFSSCKDSAIPVPKNKIDKETMVNILYDLAVLEAAKSQSMGVANNFPKGVDLIKSKYKIDSLTFAENTKYYASDYKGYKKIYDEVKERLTKQKDNYSGIVAPVPVDPEINQK